MRLEQAALEAARRWLFEPARDAQGNPIESTAQAPFSFKVF